MPQRTLHSYVHFPTQPSPSVKSASFLDLLYAIRHRVYFLTQHVRVCSIDLNQEGEGEANRPDVNKPGSPQTSRGGCCY